MLYRFIIILLMAFAITGCRGKIFSSDSMFAPKPYRMGTPDKNAPPEYLEGWQDGCETGLSTMVQGYYKSFYAFKQDPYKAEDSVYYKAWKDSYTYCRQYAFRFSWDSYDRTANKSTENPLCVLCPNELGRAQ